MFKNGKVQILVVIALIVTTLVATIAAVNPSAPSKADFPDYFQRHPELSVPAGYSLDLAGDFYQRHPELHRATVETVDTLVDRAPLDECFDVSLSEVAACREASQSPAP